MNVDNRMNEESAKGGDMMTTTGQGFCNQCIEQPITEISTVRDFVNINGHTMLIGPKKWQLPTYPMLNLCEDHMVGYTAMMEFFLAWVR
jgi:hypothetical protein